MTAAGIKTQNDLLWDLFLPDRRGRSVRLGNESVCLWEWRPKFGAVGVLAAGERWAGPTCRGCADGFICGGAGVANTTEGGCPGGNEGCKRKEVMSPAESGGGVRVIYGWKEAFKM